MIIRFVLSVSSNEASPMSVGCEVVWTCGRFNQMYLILVVSIQIYPLSAGGPTTVSLAQ